MHGGPYRPVEGRQADRPLSRGWQAPPNIKAEVPPPAFAANNIHRGKKKRLLNKGKGDGLYNINGFIRNSPADHKCGIRQGFAVATPSLTSRLSFFTLWMLFAANAGVGGPRLLYSGEPAAPLPGGRGLYVIKIYILSHVIKICGATGPLPPPAGR